MIKNLKEVKKILEENNLNENVLDEAIKQIDECSDYNKDGVYHAELKNFEMTIKRITTYYDENGNVMTDNIEDFAEAKDEDTVLDIIIDGKVYNF